MKLVESIDLNGASVDREKGVIRNAKILGLESKNGYRYSESAARQAAPLYEGAKVRADHRSGGRQWREHVADIAGAEFRSTPEPGIYAKEIVCFTEHADGRLLLEKAEKSPNSSGFSHAVEGRMNESGNVVEAITKVHGVDIVDNPATTRGIFEGLKMKKKLSDILAGLNQDHAFHGTLTEACKQHGDLEVTVGEDEATSALQVLTESLLKPKKQPTNPPVNPVIKESEFEVPGELVELTKELRESLDELKASQKVSETRKLAESILDKHNIERDEQLVQELAIIGDEKLMEARVERWPAHVKYPSMRPPSRGVEPEPIAEPASSYEGFLENLGCEVIED